MSAIEAIGLCKTFHRGKKMVEAVKDVTFSVAPGEIKGLVGASGSGKTTVLNLLLSLIEPDRGSAKLLRPAGYTAQDPFAALPDYYTVEECMAEPLRFLSKENAPDKIKQRVEIALDEVGLDYRKYGRQIPSRLSGGERQRVLIARAIIFEPKTLILDEPTSMVDENLKSGIAALIERLSAKYCPAVLLVTHDIKMAASLCHELMVMKDGQILESGLSDDVAGRPQNQYTKALVESAFYLENIN